MKAKGHYEIGHDCHAYHYHQSDFATKILKVFSVNSTNKRVLVNPSDAWEMTGFASSDGLFMHPDRWELLTDGQASLTELVQVSVVGSSADELGILPADFISCCQ